MKHIAFASMDELRSALESAGTLFADTPNYTDIEPVLQISEVLG